MTNLAGIYNQNKAEAAPDFEPIPTGVYKVWITNSEMKTTKDGTGQYLALTIEVADGDYKGKKVFENLNIINKNQTAENIAQRNLKEICEGVGINPNSLSDSQELHNKVFSVEVEKYKDSYDDKMKNKVKSFAPGASAAPSAQPAAAANAPSWMQK